MQTDSVDKIRDILFGSNMRDYERRFMLLEQRLIRSAAELSEEMVKRVGLLETYVRKEVEMLTGELRSERVDRAAGTESMTRTMSDLGATLERRAQQMSEQLARIQAELRQQIADQNAVLADESRKHRDDLHATLASRLDQLHTAKVDRQSIAEIFGELAARLNGHAPSTEGK